MKKKFLLLFVMFVSVFMLTSCFTNNDSGKKEDDNEVVETSYYVSFLNIDGTVLQETQYKEGETPKYTLATPTYSDSEYTYVFNGWDRELTPVKSDTTYTATYTKTAIDNKDSGNEGSSKLKSTLYMKYRQYGSITCDPNNDQTVTLSPATSKADGIRYHITSVNGTTNKYFSFTDNSKAVLTVSKNIPTGTYVVKVRITDNGNDEYLPGDITIYYTLTVNQKDASNSTVTKKEISNSTIEGIKSVTYNGSAFTPEPVVTYGTSILTKGTDFEYSYSNNTNAGIATVTITGKGNYTGTKSVTFTINPKTITNASDITIDDIAALTYTGFALTPTVTVKDTTRNETLVKDTDYTVIYSNNTNAALSTDNDAPTVTITGKGNYTGTKSVTFTINPKTITNASDITIDDIAALTYTGSSLTPTITVKDATRNATLVKDTDYTVIYTNNINAALSTDADAPTVTITGKGNYTGTQAVNFTINKADNPFTVSNKSGTITYSINANNNLPFDAASNVKEDANVTYTIKSQTDSDGNNVDNFSVIRNNRIQAKGRTLADTYTVVITAATAETSNYKATSKDFTYEVTVNKASWSVKETQSGPVTYNNSDNYSYADIEILDDSLSGATYTVTATDASGNDVSGYFNGIQESHRRIRIVKGTPAGKYNIKVKVTIGTDSVRYEAGEQTINYTLTINKADNPFTVSNKSGTMTYQIKPYNNLPFDAASNVKEGANITYTIKSQTDSKGNNVDNFSVISNNRIQAKERTLADTYTVVITAATAETNNYKATSKDFTYAVTVNKASWSVTESQSGSVTYNDSDTYSYANIVILYDSLFDASYTITATDASGEDVSNCFNGIQIYNSYRRIRIVKGTPAGEYDIKVKVTIGTDSVRYEAGEQTINYTLTINPEN